MSQQPSAGDDARRMQYKSGYRCFGLLGLLFIGAAIYHYDFFTKWDREVAAQKAGEGPPIILRDKSNFEGVYDRAGKWGVVAVDLGLASLFLGVSAFLFRQLRRLDDAPPSQSKTPIA